MIPVLVVPVLDRYDLLVGMEKSVDAEVRRYFVVDNGGRYPEGDALPWWEDRHVCRPGANLGFAASVNLAIKANLRAPWWFFSNDDMVYAPGDLERLADEMWKADGPRVVFMENAGFAAFAVNDQAIEAVGWFDESYHPAYCEDCDWEWRAKMIGGVTFFDMPSRSVHLASKTIHGDINRRKANDRTYPKNKEYHRAKWGGEEPREEEFRTPFDAGGDPALTMAPKLSRLRELAW